MSLHGYNYEQLSSRLCPSILNCGFMTELERSSAYLPHHIGDVMLQYRQVIYSQLIQNPYGIGLLEGDRFREIDRKSTRLNSSHVD